MNVILPGKKFSDPRPRPGMKKCLLSGRGQIRYSSTTNTTRTLVMTWGELGTLLFKDLWFFHLGIGMTEVFHAKAHSMCTL
jgi:hypothetical protein